MPSSIAWFNTMWLFLTVGPGNDYEVNRDNFSEQDIEESESEANHNNTN